MDNASGTGAGDHFQVDTALESIISGKWFGKGAGEGTVKMVTVAPELPGGLELVRRTARAGAYS